MGNRTVTVRGTDIIFLERGSTWSRRIGSDLREVEVTEPNLLNDLNRLMHNSTSETINIDGKPHKVFVSTI